MENLESSNESKEKLFTTQEVLNLVPGLNRDLLYFWVRRKKWLGAPQEGAETKGKAELRKRRRYTREEIEKIRLLYRSYQAGYRPETVGSVLGGPNLLADPKLYDRAIRAMLKITSTVPAHDLGKTLNTAVENLRRVMDVDDVSIFLIERNSRDSDETTLSLAAPMSASTLPIHASKSARDALSQLSPVAVDPNDYDGKYCRPDLSRTLEAAYCDSLLAVPMLTRLKGPIGVIEFRKRGSLQRPIASAFVSQDSAMCTVLADHLTQCVQAVRIFETQREVLKRLESDEAHNDVLDWLLSRLLLILPADRADIAIRAIDGTDVVVSAKRGPGEIPFGTPLPEESLGFRMCNRRLGDRIVERVTGVNEGYMPYWPEARSVISVAFEFPVPAPGRLAAVTAESSRPDAFDREYHGDILERITSTIALGDAVLRQGMDTRLVLASELIGDVLETIKQGPGMDSAIVYQLEPFPWEKFRQAKGPALSVPTGELHCVATAGCRDDAGLPGFRYPLTMPSFAKKIAETGRPQFSADPRRDHDVCAAGLDWFDIHGPLIGAPIVHQDVVVGALVCWSRNTRSPVEDDKHRLLPYAKILGSSLFLSQNAAKYRSKRLLDVKRVLLQMQAEPSKKEALKIILEALMNAGFDRARAFRYLARPHVFEPLCCVGMQDPVRFYETRIDIQRSFYAQKTFAEWRQAKEAIRVHPDPDQADPYEQELGKQAGWPWVQTTLVIHDKLYGYLAADNHLTKRPITQDMLDFLTVMGVLAAQAIQNEDAQSVASSLGQYALAAAR